MAAEGAGALELSDLPAFPDKVISEILVRLPPKALLRFRAVCTAWRRLATDRDLLLDHHLRQPTQYLLQASREIGDYGEPALLQYRLEAVDLRTDKRRMAVRFTDLEYDEDSLGVGVYGAFEVHASCDGLLLLNFLDGFFVCNPATRQVACLPPLIRARGIAGLYPHAASGEYRVLYHRDEGLERKYYVLTVGSHQARSIERRASSASVGEGLARGVERACTAPPVLLHGSLHWPPQRRQEDNILVFDTADESFRWMRPPVIRKDKFLSEMDGKLAMSCCEQNGWRADLWLMQDYKNEAWVCKYRIELPVAEINRLGKGLPWDVTIVSQEGDMLVECLDMVLHYDNKGKLLWTFHCDGRSLFFSRHMLKESLVPHAFLQMQQADGGPPFFRWL